MERSEPWFDDGNIILAAQGKSFRVHRSVLGSCSEVFKDMFAIPHSDDIEENIVDGCPVVHLQDESGDVHIILKALYDRSYLFFRDEPMSIAVLVAFLRLSKKYAIGQLFKEAVHRLRPEEPLLEYTSGISNSRSMTLFPRVSSTDPCNFMIMNIANEVGNLSTVAIAIAIYYCYVACPALSILDGYDFDGTRCTLSLSNQRYCFLGQRYVADARKELSELLAGASSDCAGPNDCSTISILGSFYCIRGPFMAWEGFWDDELCLACRKDIKEDYEETRTRLWKDFPVTLGLGSWNNLDKDIEILRRIPDAK